MDRAADRCPLCESTDVAVAFPGLERVRRCGSCRLGWTTGTDGGAAAYDESFFGGDYYTAYFARAEQWRHEARRRLSWLLTMTRPASLLEIGCGGGFFLEAARAVGIEVRGVEPAADGAAYARETLGLPVVTGLFEQVEPQGTFDVVCAFHVLEHVDDPVDFLERARAHVRPGGHVALEVPNIDSARARRDGARWFNLVPDYHLWHFSAASLTRVVTRATLTPLSVETTFHRRYLRARRLLTPSGVRSLAADLSAAPTLRRSDPTRGDYLRLLAARP